MPDLDYHHIFEWHLRIFVTLSLTLTGRKNLRFSLTENCVMRYGSNLRKLYSGCVCCILAHCAMEAPTPSRSRSSCVA